MIIKTTCNKLLLSILFLFATTALTQAQIAQRGDATNNVVTSGDLTISKPSGVLEGDVLIANIIQNDNDDRNLSDVTASGWTEIDGREIYSNNGDTWRGTILYKIAGGSESSSYSFSTDNDIDMAIGSIVAFSGVDVSGTAPFDSTPVNISTGSSSSPTVSSININTVGTALIMFTQISDNRSHSSWTNSLSEIYDNQTTSGDDASIGAAWKIVNTTGASGDGSVTISNSERWGALYIALKPIINTPPISCSTDAVMLPWTEGFEDTYNNSYTSDNSNTGNCWEYNQTNDGRVDFNLVNHTGSKSALFYDDDRSTNDSAENVLTKTINLSNYTNATDLELSFWFADYGDENDGEDAVWIRGNDTADWIKIYDIKPENFSDSQWNQITGLDIDQTLNDAGQTISETFQIRIGQEDNYEYSNDGIAFDDLQITGTIGNVIDLSSLFSEDFEDENQGDTSGTDLYGTDWNTDITNTSPNRFEVRSGNHFQADETDGVAKWITNPININGYTNLNLSAYLEFDSGLDDGSGRGNLDYIKFLYKLDGANAVEIATYNGINNNGDYTWDLSNMTGSTLELIIEFQSDNNNNEIHIVDNINLTGEKVALWKNDISTNDSHNFNPYTTNEEFNSDITVSGIIRGDGITPKGRNNTYNAQGWDSENFDANDYFEFILTPSPSHEINFESFVFNTSISNNDTITNIEVRSSLDNFSTGIGSISENGAFIDLTAQEFQAISTPITFRIYAWGANTGDTELGIDNFAFYGAISHFAYWNNSTWVNNYLPEESYKTVIDDDYDTAMHGSFSCHQLIINEGVNLTVNNETYVDVENNVIVNGELVVETKGAFVQRDNNGTFTVNGISKVNKSTPYKNQWYYYTYWSSPVKDLNIESLFWSIGGKFYFDGSGWQYATGQIMQPGKGYITRADDAGVQTASFTGEFNTGTITTPIVYNEANNVKYNLIGNPYPSSIDLDEFLVANNTVIEGAAYFWSQETPPVGGQFSGEDYIPYNATGSVSTSPDLTRAVNGFVPSGQSFFTIGKTAGNATFTNDMRMADATSNSQFFKSSNGIPTKGSIESEEKIWINLSSKNGVFSQILVGYIDGATHADDGLTFDATKFGQGSGAYLYSTIENSDKKFVIQGKDANGIHSDEVITIGFKTTIAASYTISIGKLQGVFLNENTIYLKDNLLNITHDLSANEYAFNSEVGEFNNRFEIHFKNQALSTDTPVIDLNNFKIIELNNDYMQFSVPNNVSIKKVTVFDLLGKHIIDLNGNNSTEKYQLHNLNSSIYIAKVTLNDGQVITKKFIKK